MFNYGMPTTYNQQTTLERINNQIAELEKIKNQVSQAPVQQPTNLTQNFQLAPNNSIMKYANSIEDVKRDVVIGEAPYFSKDMSVVWVKNTKNEIKTYELTEIIPKNEKDIQIELLQEQINQLRKEMKENEQFNTNDITTENEQYTEEFNGEVGATTKTSKPTSVSRISASKKK